MALTQREIAKGLVSKLRLLSDEQLLEVYNNLPEPTQDEIVNVAFRSICIENEEQLEQFVCGDGDRPHKPPTS